MADRTCPKCGKTFRFPAHLRDHKSRKTPCAPIALQDELPEKDQQKAHACKYCARRFATLPSLNRHIRQNCKIANSDEGMERLMEHTLQRQNATLAAKVDTLQAQMAEMTGMMRQLVASPAMALAAAAAVPAAAPVPAAAAPPAAPLAQTIGSVNTGTIVNLTNNIQVVNIVGFDREDRIHIPVALVKAAFTENPRLMEYCRMTDEERTDADKAAPYVLEALLDLVRRAHRDPVYRNVYLNPKRSDQVIVCLDEERARAAPQRWEVRSLIEAIRLLFDGVADNLHKIITTDQDRTQLPFDVQSAASWVPNLYEDEPDRFVKDGRAPMAAHLQNTRPGDEK